MLLKKIVNIIDFHKSRVFVKIVIFEFWSGVMFLLWRFKHKKNINDRIQKMMYDGDLLKRN